MTAEYEDVRIFETSPNPVLTEANNLLLFTPNFWTIPGGAGAPKDIVIPLMRAAALKHWQQLRTLHYLAMIHTDTNPVIDDFEFNHETQRQAALRVHAERSCGGSQGNSDVVRNQMRKNIRTFLGKPGSNIPNFVIHPIEVEIGNGFDKYGRVELRYLVDEKGITQHRTRSPRYTKLTYEEFNQFLLEQQQTGVVAGLACIDSRQGLVTPAVSGTTGHEISDEVSNHTGKEYRRDWVGSNHNEPYAVMVIDNCTLDLQATEFAVQSIQTPFATILRRGPQEYIYPTSPMIIKIPSSMLTGSNGRWFGKTMSNLVASMDTHTYRRSPFYLQIRQRYKTYSVEDGVLASSNPPDGFVIYHSGGPLQNRFFENNRAGILIDAHNPVPVIPGKVPFSGRNFGVKIPRDINTHA